MSLRILIYLAKGRPAAFERDRAAFLAKLRELGALTVRYEGQKDSLDEQLTTFRRHDIVILFHASLALPDALIQDRGELKLVCGALGSIRKWIPRRLLEAGLPVTNWGTSPAYGIAEGAFCLLLATLKSLHRQINIIRDDGWKMPRDANGGSMRNLQLGVYGCGVIGQKFLEFVRPFSPLVRVFDPYAPEVPAWVERVPSLEALFSQSQAVVIHAGLTDETRHSVTAELLAMLPEGGVVVNTARGGIIDQDALFRELETGRLRAGLDVLDPDWLPPGHPAKQWDNCIFTSHSVDRGWPLFGQARTVLAESEVYCLENIKNFFGTPQTLQFRITPEQYDRMT